MLVRRKYLGKSSILQKHVDYSRLISIAEVAGVQQEVILIDDVNNVLISKVWWINKCAYESNTPIIITVVRENLASFSTPLNL